MTHTYTIVLCCLHCFNIFHCIFYNRCHTKSALGWVCARQTFFWHDSDTHVRTWICVTWLICLSVNTWYTSLEISFVLRHNQLHQYTWGQMCVTRKQVFVVVGYDIDYKILLYCLHRLYSVVGVIPKEGLAEGLVGPQPANPSLGMTPTKTF